MTITDLLKLYAIVYRTLRKERNMREQVFRSKPELMQTKLAEIDAALAALDAMKDELKERLTPKEPQQLPLLDAPERKSY
ncbi:MAG: hypothetical protein R3A44_44230 [Caldilineaceae bacterium]